MMEVLNMSKRFVVVIDGYVRKEVYDELYEAFSKNVGYELDSDFNGVHVYPYNTEGYQLFVASNAAIPSSDLNDLVCACSDIDAMEYNKGVQDAGGILYETPIQVGTEGWDISQEYWFLGGIRGYDSEGVERPYEQ